MTVDALLSSLKLVLLTEKYFHLCRNDLDFFQSEILKSDLFHNLKVNFFNRLF